jgi:hypothetical protein
MANGLGKKSPKLIIMHNIGPRPSRCKLPRKPTLVGANPIGGLSAAPSMNFAEKIKAQLSRHPKDIKEKIFGA